LLFIVSVVSKEVSKLQSRKKALLKRVEELRQELINLEKGKNLSDHEIIKTSHDLDTILNEYYRMSLKFLP